MDVIKTFFELIPFFKKEYLIEFHNFLVKPWHFEHPNLLNRRANTKKIT